MDDSSVLQAKMHSRSSLRRRPLAEDSCAGSLTPMTAQDASAQDGRVAAEKLGEALGVLARTDFSFHDGSSLDPATMSCHD